MRSRVLDEMKDDAILAMEVIAEVLLLVFVVIIGGWLLTILALVIWSLGQLPAWPFLIIIAVMGWLWSVERRTRPISHWKP